MKKNKRELEKEKRRDKRKEEILQASEELFLEKGISSTKMTDIAKACELGKGTLYFYFKSKDEVIWQLLMKHSLAEFEAGSGFIKNLKGSGYEKLARYLRLFAEDFLESFNISNPTFLYREYITNLITENKLNDSMKQEFQSIFRRNLSSIIGLVEEGIEDGSVKNIMDPQTIGGAIGTAFGSYFRYVISLKASFDDQFIKEAKENYRAFTTLMLISIKNQED